MVLLTCPRKTLTPIIEKLTKKEELRNKKSKHTEEQIIGFLKQLEAGRTVKDVARELGVSEATIYTWKSRFGGMKVSEARRSTALNIWQCGA